MLSTESIPFRSLRDHQRIRDRRREMVLEGDVLEERILLYNFSGQSWADADYTEVLSELIASYEEQYAYLEDVGSPMTPRDIWQYELEPVISTWVEQGLLPANWEESVLGGNTDSAPSSTDDSPTTDVGDSYHAELPSDELLDGLAGSESDTPENATSSPEPVGNVLPASIDGVNFHWNETTGILEIQGTAGDDGVTVMQSRDKFVAYHTTNGAELQSFSISAASVRGISFLGGDGNDRFANQTTIGAVADGEAGDDILFGGSSHDFLYGGDGADVIYGQEGDDYIDGGAGDDLLFGGNGYNAIHGGDGNDVVQAGAGGSELFGGAGDDTIQGGSGDDFIDGGAGNDVVIAGAGNNFVDGGDGHDVIHGGEWSDLLRGGAGDDQIFGYAGDDLLVGGAGTDVIVGGLGVNEIHPDEIVEDEPDPPTSGRDNSGTNDPGSEEDPTDSGGDNGGTTDPGSGEEPAGTIGEPDDEGTPGSVEDLTPVTASIQAITGATTIHTANAIQITFSSAVQGLDLSDLSLTREYSDARNLLTGDQTLTTLNGVVWTLGNLAPITQTAGAYNLVLRGTGTEIVGAGGAPLDEGDTIRFVVMPEVLPSDDLIRFIMNAGHQFMDHERFTNIDEMDGDSYLTLGTRIRFNLDSAYSGAMSDPFAGTYADDSRTSLRDVYERMYREYKEDHPGVIVGSYVGGISLKDAQKVLQLGHWPPDAESLDQFDPSWVNAAISTSPHNNGTVDLSNPAAREALYQEHLRRALGLGSTNKQDAVIFDEVGYTYASWRYNVEMYSRIKREANDQGVLVGINLGGFGWTDPAPFIDANILEELPEMADIVTIENIWSRKDAPTGGSYRSVENTQKTIENLRQVMDAGMTVGLLPTTWEWNANTFDVSAVQEVVQDGQSMLMVKLNQDHNIWPARGDIHEQFRLKDLPAAYKGLQNYAWTAVEVPGRPDHVLLYTRTDALGDIKKDLGISGNIQFSGGHFQDFQATTRLLAGFATLLRRPGDSIFVHYSPGGAFPGDGDPTNTDNWWYWPEQLGDPTAEYVIDSVDSTGVISHMHRAFEHGILHLYPEEGRVSLEMYS